MILEILWCSICTQVVILLGGVKTQGKNGTSLKEIFLKVIDQNHLVFLKVYLKLEQITKDERGSYCDGEIKERFVNIILFLSHLTLSFKVDIAYFGLPPTID